MGTLVDKELVNPTLIEVNEGRSFCWIIQIVQKIIHLNPGIRGDVTSSHVRKNNLDPD